MRKYLLVTLTLAAIGCERAKVQLDQKSHSQHEVRVGRTDEELKILREQEQARRELEEKHRMDAKIAEEQRRAEENRIREEKLKQQEQQRQDRLRREEEERRLTEERRKEVAERQRQADQQRAEQERRLEELRQATPISHLTRAEKRKLSPRELVDKSHEEQRMGRPAVLLRYAVCLRACGKYKEAEARLSDILDAYPKSKEAQEAKELLQSAIRQAERTRPPMKNGGSEPGGVPKTEQFLGRWRIVNDKGITATYFTLTKTLEAKKDHAPNAPGKWQVVGDEVRITWSDGWRDLFRPQEGEILVISYGPGAEWDKLPAQPVRTQRAFKMEK